MNAEDAKILIEPLDITNKEKMEEQLSRLGSNEAKAEAIQTRQVEVLESQRYVDPIRYMTFMERIKRQLLTIWKSVIVKSICLQWRRWQKTTAQVEILSNILKTLWMIAMQKSFYGAVCAGIKKSTGATDVEISEELGQLALDIKAVIVKHTKRDWRDNVIVHRDIKKALDDLLFDYMEDHKLEWSLDTIDIIIDEIMMVAKKGY